MVRVVSGIPDDGVEALTGICLHVWPDGEWVWAECNLGNTPACWEHSRGSCLIDAVGGVGAGSMHDIIVVPLVSQNPSLFFSEGHVLAFVDNSDENLALWSWSKDNISTIIWVVGSTFIDGK